jgi:TonB family protein
MIGIRPIAFTIAAILSLAIPPQFSNAQDQQTTATSKLDTKNLDIGLPKALKRLEAKYPDDAKAILISGTVVVEFVVDKEEKVISPRAISGHPILKPAVVEAAKGWEFEIPMHNEQPTKLLGSMTFCFLAGEDISKSRYTFFFEKCCAKRAEKPDDWCTDSK